MVKSAQMKIQQMTLMIIAVFIFFIIVGLFIAKINFRGLDETTSNLQREETLAAVSFITGMTELSCNSKSSNCLDGDKLEVMSSRSNYKDLWPIASLEIYKIHPFVSKEIMCPAVDCNYYKVFEISQNQTTKVSTYINICYKRMEDSRVYDKCEIAKILVGIKK